MIPGLTSIVVPCFNHAQWLMEAIDSALAQTAPVEVIVVDDGSTDGTNDLVGRIRTKHVGDLLYLRAEHAGVSAARNRGIQHAEGEFVMFLDADDVIGPTKVEEQLRAFDDQVGWVLCDVRIEDERRGTVENASDRYRYKHRQLGGWIRGQLAVSNFIPVMSPLVRRSVLGDDVRFSDSQPEDWHFWYAVAAHARVRYLPKVLATYRKRRTGRSRSGIPDVAPVDGPVILNLGCGTPGAQSWHPMPGCVNLDRAMGWCFEDGLEQYADGSIEAVTISHALMYVHESDWPRVFAEFARVLKPGGVIRITEDDAEDRASSRFGGWKGSEPAVTMTSAARLRAALRTAGLTPYDVTEQETKHPTDALRQAQHGMPPDVFFIEGVKEVQAMAVLFSPHSDDETLFAAFTIIKHRPKVVICYPSTRDYGETWVREAESNAAMEELGAGPVEQWRGGDLEGQMRALDVRLHPARVWAPDVHASHPDHVAVARAAAAVFGDRVTTYHTYIDGQKVRGESVGYEPSWVCQKLRALARYETQIAHPRAGQFFAADLAEFYGEAGV